LGASAVPIDSGAYSIQQLLDKLVRDRVVVPQPGDAGPRGSGSIQMVDRPDAKFDAYLMVAKAYRSAHPQLVEAVWNGLGARAVKAAKASSCSSHLARPTPPAQAYCTYAG